MCLLNALDFVGAEDNPNIFRFPDLLNNPDKSFVTLGNRMINRYIIFYENLSIKIYYCSFKLKSFNINNQNYNYFCTIIGFIHRMPWIM